MSSFYVRFECKEDLDLLAHLVSNTIRRLETTPSSFVDIAESMYRVSDSLHSAAPLKDAHLIDVPDDVIQKDKDNQPKSRKSSSKAPTAALALCQDHKTYQAKQVPRTACEGCWVAYKKFNPTKYATARRKFDRKQNSA